MKVSKLNKEKNDSVKHDKSPLNAVHAEIADWLKKVRFKKAFLGVSEEDVWKKIEQLDSLYTSALKAERVRYDALLKEHGITPESDDRI